MGRVDPHMPGLSTWENALAFVDFHSAQGHASLVAEMLKLSWRQNSHTPQQHACIAQDEPYCLTFRRYCRAFTGQAGQRIATMCPLSLVLADGMSPK